MRQLSVAIVGITYPNKAKGPTRLFELALCVPGERVELRPEPKNEHDEHAIAVFSARGVQLGYLPSERAVLIGSIMRRGVEVRAIFQALADTVAWCRVAFDEDPVLPPVANQAKVEDDDFYPDDPGGEWGA
jgi:hypothetical protein